VVYQIIRWGNILGILQAAMGICWGYKDGEFKQRILRDVMFFEGRIMFEASML
jgi:hypothetical protein